MRDGLLFLAVGRGVLPLSLALLGWNARYAGAVAVVFVRSLSGVVFSGSR